MHTGPRGPLLFGWCTHYVPTTSHQPLAIFCTAPTPLHTLQARLHCYIWMCPSIHVSHCLEDFSPQTSPSGTIYPMVGVPSMCPPHQFSQFPTSTHLFGPTQTSVESIPNSVAPIWHICCRWVGLHLCVHTTIRKKGQSQMYPSRYNGLGALKALSLSILDP